MKKLLLVAMLLFLFSPVNATELKDLGPSQGDLDRATDRAEQGRGQRELERQQERERVPSEAERRIDKIPKKTTVRPIHKNGGGGVEVTIPNK